MPHKTFSHWVSGGCGTTRLNVEIKKNKTFDIVFYSRWMGGNNWEWKLSGTTKFIRIKMVSKKTGSLIGLKRYYKLNVKKIIAKNLDGNSDKTSASDQDKIYELDDIKIVMKIILAKKAKLTKLESGEEEWYGMGGSWNEIRDAILVVSKKATKVDEDNCLKTLCQNITKRELTLSTKNNYVTRNGIRLNYRNDLDTCENYKNLASVHIVFEDSCAVNNNIIEFLFEKVLKEEKIPETLYVDGSGEFSQDPIKNPKGFPTIPIATMSRSSEVNFLRSVHSTPYHLMQVIKTNGTTDDADSKKYVKKFNNTTKRLALVMGSEFETENFDTKMDTNDSKTKYTFLTKANMDYSTMRENSVNIVCQLPGQSNLPGLPNDESSITYLDFGKVSYELIKNKKGDLATMLAKLDI
jgi:hypothetical protein